MSPAAFFTTFGMIFLAELGDKTQLTAVALAARYPWRRAFIGIALAFAVLNVLAVGVGQVLFRVVPLPWIQVVSTALFLFFGISTLRSAGEEEDEEARAKKKERGPVLTAFTLIFFAELGDKTQLATASLAATLKAPVLVFAGSTLALWLVSLLGLLVGEQLARRIPAKTIHRIAGTLFLVFAAVMGYQAARGLLA